MPSKESDALRAQFQNMSDRFTADPDMSLTTLRSMMEELGDLASEPENVTYGEVDTDGVRGIWCNPLDASPDHLVFYCHGGGFVGNSAASHRKMAAHLAKAVGARSFVLEYRRAPENPYPAQLEDALAAFAWLRGQGFEAGNIVTAGDSAGGNLAVTLVLALRDRGEQLPAAIIGFSPWVDMEHLGKTLDSNAETDAFVNRGVAESMASMFLGESGSPTDPLANPLHADLTGLPPLIVTAGSAETLQDNAERLAERASAAGVEVDVTVAPDQQHVYPFMAGRAPEADEALAAAAGWARRHLGLA
ncbi:alpha/beta hydrolase [Pseudonocardia endophytica]|uniref:Acetyl esterase/lipase n=1 Tax=Pseudonocardia endophytica TaxID=401976 RepID=A0A4R1HR65_PSEEN|nr:alpha/beta hydrolase [Pseudonocardia endophytica]TCK22259.1 acetyl esterase/lipase [Pseudonocardia endophytica]